MQAPFPARRLLRTDATQEDAMNAIVEKLGPSATDMIRADHTRVLAAFHRYAPDLSPREKRGIADTICLALEVHAQIEEEIFYPALQRLDPEIVAKSLPEHAEMKRLILALRGMSPSDLNFDATMMELMRKVIHHVADEETTLLPDAERQMPAELPELGVRMAKRRLELKAPRTGEMVGAMAKAMSGKGMLIGAGAALLGGALIARALTRR
jgi:hemerythrin superfamily protein